MDDVGASGYRVGFYSSHIMLIDTLLRWCMLVTLQYIEVICVCLTLSVKRGSLVLAAEASCGPVMKSSGSAVTATETLLLSSYSNPGMQPEHHHTPYVSANRKTSQPLRLCGHQIETRDANVSRHRGMIQGTEESPSCPHEGSN